MYITKEEVQKILTVMEKFPDARTYHLKVDNSSGIGSTLTLTMEMNINGTDTNVIVEISGVETW